MSNKQSNTSSSTTTRRRVTTNRRTKQSSQQSRQQPNAVLLYQLLVDKTISKILNTLITKSVSSKYLYFVSQIFQPIHAQDVMDERVLAGVCAYPVCANSI